jgi:hypothetical protein
MSPSTLLHDAAIGGAAGAAATVVMSAVMLGAQRVGVERAEQPPERIVEAGLDAVGADRSESAENLLASVLHLAFGAGCGAVYRMLRRLLATPGAPVLHGIGFGLGVWAVSYAGWVPALGIMPPPHRDQPGRAGTMVVGHVVYGAVLGAIAEPGPSGPAGLHPGAG